jgi:hypothetical protein
MTKNLMLALLFGSVAGWSQANSPRTPPGAPPAAQAKAEKKRIPVEDEVEILRLQVDALEAQTDTNKLGSQFEQSKTKASEVVNKLVSRAKIAAEKTCGPNAEIEQSAEGSDKQKVLYCTAAAKSAPVK